MAIAYSPAILEMLEHSFDCRDALTTAIDARPALITALNNAVGQPAIDAAQADLDANKAEINSQIDNIVSQASEAYQSELVGQGVSAAVAAQMALGLVYAMTFALIYWRIE
jgi:preprotein translocase subunit SecF